MKILFYIDDIAFGQIMKALNENGHYKELGFMSASLLKKLMIVVYLNHTQTHHMF
jgi:hypothetical protein